MTKIKKFWNTNLKNELVENNIIKSNELTIPEISINYFIKENNQYDIPLIIIVGKENENNQLKSDISTSIKELDKERIIEPNVFNFSNLS